jgi:uncharacterized protein
MLRSKPRRVKILGLTLAVLAFLYTGLSIFGAVAAIPMARLPVTGSPAQVGLAFEEVAFHTRGDNLPLRGWYIPGNGERAIIVVHGGRQNREDEVVDTLGLARDLHAGGFDILLFDLRGRGESGGNARTLMNVDNDLGGAFDYVKSLGFAPQSIGMLGFCSGAASAAIFASREQVGALVLNSCFASVMRMVRGQATERHIPGLVVDTFMPGVHLAAFLLYGYREVDPLEVMPNVDAPVLFIHEENDDLTNLADTQLLLDASTNPASSLWEIPGALHSEGYRTDSGGYVSSVSAFFNSSLIPRA